MAGVQFSDCSPAANVKGKHDRFDSTKRFARFGGELVRASLELRRKRFQLVVIRRSFVGCGVVLESRSFDNH